MKKKNTKAQTLVSIGLQVPEFRVELSEKIRKDPVTWCYELFGVAAWRGKNGRSQADLLESIFWNPRTCAGTGHGLGKTHLAQVVPPLWLLGHWDNLKCGCVVIGASWDATRSKIFPGMSARIEKGRFEGIGIGPLPTATELRWADEILCKGLSPMRAEPAQGWHYEGGVLILVDEASHLDHTIFDALLSNLTGPNDHIALFGNPIRSDGPHADILTGRMGGNKWNRITISSFDSPNVIDPEENRYPGLATTAWIDDIAREKWPEGTPEWQSRVLGITPDQDDNVYIPRSMIEAAIARETIPWQEDTNLTLGADVARSAVGDQTVLVVRGDHSLHYFKAFRGLTKGEIMHEIYKVRAMFSTGWVPPKKDAEAAATMELDKKRDKKKYAAACHNLHCALNESRLSRIPVDNVFVDGTGVGSGLCDDLEVIGYPASVRVMASGKAHDSLGCANRRAECWKNLKGVLSTLAIPEELGKHFAGVATLRYRYDKSNRLLIELKEEYKKRNEYSPDEADALALTCYREPGQKAFEMALDRRAIKIPAMPSVTREPRRIGQEEKISWWLHVEGQPIIADTPGELMRAVWLSRDSACIWVHVDKNGLWTVLDYLETSNITIRAFWARVMEKSQGHSYTYDVFSAPDNAEHDGESHLQSELWAVANGIGKTYSPVPVAARPGALKGTAGMDTLHRLLLSSLSYYPSSPYWKNNKLNPAEFRQPSALYVWPDSVVDAITRARLEERSWTDEPTEDRPESLVASGGPLVRCLRLLAVQGAAL